MTDEIYTPRSNHNDFATSKELVDRNFSGIRENSLTNNREIWLEGNLVATMNIGIINKYPGEWEILYKEVFAMKKIKTLERGN